MTFEHHCLTDDEANQELKERLAAISEEPPMVWRWRATTMATAMMAVTLVLGLLCVATIVIYLPDSSSWIPVPLGGVALGMTVGLAWQGWAVNEEAAITNQRKRTRDAFSPARTDQLDWLAKQRQQHPEVGVAIAGWLDQGLMIRQRDVEAVRAYVVKVEPVKERARLLHALARPHEETQLP